MPPMIQLPMDDIVESVSETIRRYGSPTAHITDLISLPMRADEQGWSGGELRRYEVHLRDRPPVRIVTKTTHLIERKVSDLLSRQGHQNVPFAYSPDLDTDAPALLCMEDLGTQKLGLPGGTPILHPPEVDRQVAEGLAAIHAANLDRAEFYPWLPHADHDYVTGFILAQVWRSWWDDALRNKSGFAREFDRYTRELEAAADRFTAAMDGLWREGTSLTLTHGELHSEHILLHEGRPHFIDWATAHYGPFYLDLVPYFTPADVHLYRGAMDRRGIVIPRAAFMERYHEVGRYVGFKWLCSGIWQWGSGPTEETGRRLLHMIAWAVGGQWPDRPFLLSEAAWQRLLAQHCGGP